MGNQCSADVNEVFKNEINVSSPPKERQFKYPSKDTLDWLQNIDAFTPVADKKNKLSMKTSISAKKRNRSLKLRTNKAVQEEKVDQPNTETPFKRIENRVESLSKSP